VCLRNIPRSLNSLTLNGLQIVRQSEISRVAAMERALHSFRMKETEIRFVRK